MKVKWHFFYIGIIAGVLCGAVRQKMAADRAELRLLDVVLTQEKEILALAYCVICPNDTAGFRKVSEAHDKSRLAWQRYAKEGGEQ